MWGRRSRSLFPGSFYGVSPDGAETIYLDGNPKKTPSVVEKPSRVTDLPFRDAKAQLILLLTRPDHSCSGFSHKKA
jgi:hypothetical protein